MHHSANMARASGVSVNDRHARVGYLRGLLAQRQARFLLTTGNDQARVVLKTSKNENKEQTKERVPSRDEKEKKRDIFANRDV